jgi:hypothetical protein
MVINHGMTGNEKKQIYGNPFCMAITIRTKVNYDFCCVYFDMFSIEQEAEECDARNDDSSTAAGIKNVFKRSTVIATASVTKQEAKKSHPV